MLELPVDGRAIHRAAEWLEASAASCALQASSSVGLVHGIAHVLEPALAGADVERPFGHARLCALFLAPVLAFDRAHGATFEGLLAVHGLDPGRLEAVARALFDPDAYRVALGVLAERWRDVLRDPCTRTNAALVRPAHLAHFQAFDPHAGYGA
jgi:alcohol dehydrogenase class IV